MFPGIIILHGDSQFGHSGLHPHRPLADLGALGAQVLEDLVRLSQYAGELSDGLQCNVMVMPSLSQSELINNLVATVRPDRGSCWSHTPEASRSLRAPAWRTPSQAPPGRRGTASWLVCLFTSAARGLDLFVPALVLCLLCVLTLWDSALNISLHCLLSAGQTGLDWLSPHITLTVVTMSHYTGSLWEQFLYCLNVSMSHVITGSYVFMFHCQNYHNIFSVMRLTASGRLS